MGFLFAILSPFFDTLVNFLDKFLLSKYTTKVIFLAVFSGFFACITGLIAAFFVGFHADLVTSAIILSSGVLSVFIVLLYLKALTYDETSRVASLFQLIPIFAIVLSFLFLGERLFLKQYIGCFLVIAAGFSLCVKKPKKGIFRINKAFWYMMFADLIFAAVSVLFKIGATDIGFWKALPYEGLGNGIGVLAIIFYGNNMRELFKEAKRIPKKVFLFLSIGEVIYRASRYTFYFALLLVSVSIVNLFQGFQPVFLLVEGIILTILFPHILKEDISKKTLKLKLASIIGMFVGLYLIFL